jgi:ubiquinone/menaquinone biosynthesis C-methylase UbiE
MRIISLGVLLLVAACSGPAEEPQGAETTPEPVVEEEVNLDLWLERLEVGSRELYSAREAVVEAVGLKPGDWVADVGSGTGLYTLMFAEKVGEEGQVFAEDIEPLFLDLVARRAADADLKNISAVFGREDDVTLPANSMDVVFIADTYHYFDDREAVMRSVLKALKPGGVLILVEFDIAPGEERPDYKSHVKFGKDAVVSEIEFVGFQFVEEKDVEGLDENYFVQFTKPASDLN